MRWFCFYICVLHAVFTIGNCCFHCCLVAKSCLTLETPWTVACQSPLGPWGSPGKNTGVGSYALLQGIFHIQGPNPHLRHWQSDSLPLSHLGSPTVNYYVSDKTGVIFPPWQWATKSLDLFFFFFLFLSNDPSVQSQIFWKGLRASWDVIGAWSAILTPTDWKTNSITQTRDDFVL